MLALSHKPTLVRRRNVVCKSQNFDAEVKRFLEKRNEVDRRRLDTLKQGADRFKEVLRQELKDVSDLVSIVVPVQKIRETLKTKKTDDNSE